MRYRELSSFSRSFRRLPSEEKARVRKAIVRFIDGVESSALSPGLGLKKLSPVLWEIRVGLELRVVFLLRGDLVEWGYVGTHDQLRRFIRGRR